MTCMLLFGVSKTTYQFDLIMMCIAVNDMSKISKSTIGGGEYNTASGTSVINVHECVNVCVIV